MPKLITNYNRVKRFVMPANVLLRMQSGVFRITGADIPEDARILDVQIRQLGEEWFISPVVESDTFPPTRDGEGLAVMESACVEKIDFEAALKSAYEAGSRWRDGGEEHSYFDEWYDTFFGHESGQWHPESHGPGATQ